MSDDECKCDAIARVYLNKGKLICYECNLLSPLVEWTDGEETVMMRKGHKPKGREWRRVYGALSLHTHASLTAKHKLGALVPVPDENTGSNPVRGILH